MKSFLGKFYRHLAIFFWSHCHRGSLWPRRRSVTVIRLYHSIKTRSLFPDFLFWLKWPSFLLNGEVIPSIRFYNMGQTRPLFRLFSSFSHSNNKYSFIFNNINWKKHRWCAWDSNLELQDDRCRRNHGAMAAALQVSVLPHILMLQLKFKMSVDKAKKYVSFSK